MKYLVSVAFVFFLFDLFAQEEAWLGEGGINLLEDGEIHIPQHFRCDQFGTDSVQYTCIAVHYKGEAEYFQSTITDSLGNIIYQTNDINDCWNGITSDNERIPPGTYTWKVSAKMVNNNEAFEFEGPIRLFCLSEEDLNEMIQNH